MDRPRAGRRALGLGSIAWLIISCGVTERTVQELSTAGAPIRGGSTGSGGGSAIDSGGGSSSGGKPGKPDPNAPDPLFPPFKNGSICESTGGNAGTMALPPPGGAPAGEGGSRAGAAGDSGSGGCCGVQLLSQGKRPSGLVADSGEAFWVDLGNVLVSATLERSAHLVARFDDTPGAIALDSKYVYVQTTAAIFKVAREGGPPEMLVANQSSRQLAVDHAYAYWVADRAGRGELRRWSLARATGETLAQLDSLPPLWLDPVPSLAVDDDSVYVLSKSQLVQIAQCAQRQTVLATTSGSGGGLAVDAGYAYWSEDESLLRVPRGGGVKEMLTREGPANGHFAVGHSYVYWGEVSLTNPDDLDSAVGQIRRMPVGGGEAEVIATGLTEPSVYAVDDRRLYFIDDARVFTIEAPW